MGGGGDGGRGERSDPASGLPATWPGSRLLDLSRGPVGRLGASEDAIPGRRGRLVVLQSYTCQYFVQSTRACSRSLTRTTRDAPTRHRLPRSSHFCPFQNLPC